jgi:hypothetical protein
VADANLVQQNGLAVRFFSRMAGLRVSVGVAPSP